MTNSEDADANPTSQNQGRSWEEALFTDKGRPGLREVHAALEVLRAQIQLGEGTRARLFRPIRGPRRIRLPERAAGDVSVRILLTLNGSSAIARRLNQVCLRDLILCHPMRDFSRRHGQTNKPVAYFSRTVGDLVACESQHERRFLILADWQERVAHVAAQPFTIDFPPGHELDSHTPDFVLITASGIVVVVDVKWPSDAIDDDVVRRHAIVERVLAKAGMRHVVWTDAPRIITENLANFAAARVPEGMMGELSPKLIDSHRPGVRVQQLLDVVEQIHQVPTPTTLVVLRRMLWDHQFVVDMLAPFTLGTEVWRP